MHRTAPSALGSTHRAVLIASRRGPGASLRTAVRIIGLLCEPPAGHGPCRPPHTVHAAGTARARGFPRSARHNARALCLRACPWRSPIAHPSLRGHGACISLHSPYSRARPAPALRPSHPRTPSSCSLGSPNFCLKDFREQHFSLHPSHIVVCLHSAVRRITVPYR